MKTTVSRTLSLILLASVSVVLLDDAEAAYVVENEANDTAAAAQSLDAFFSDIPDAVIELDSSGALGIPNASVYGFSGNGTYDYYSVSVGTGASPLNVNTAVVFDIDFAEINGLDTILTLFGTNGTTVLATNDDSPFDGPGDLAAFTFNSFISYTFSAAGVYFIRVGEFDSAGPAGVLATDATYHLHVSTEPVPVPASVWLFGSALLGLGVVGRWRRVTG